MSLEARLTLTCDGPGCGEALQDCGTLRRHGAGQWQDRQEARTWAAQVHGWGRTRPGDRGPTGDYCPACRRLPAPAPPEEPRRLGPRRPPVAAPRATPQTPLDGEGWFVRTREELARLGIGVPGRGLPTPPALRPPPQIAGAPPAAEPAGPAPHDPTAAQIAAETARIREEHLESLRTVCGRPPPAGPRPREYRPPPKPGPDHPWRRL